MNLELSEEHLMIQQAARDFTRNECLPGVIERDDKMQFPREQIMKLADLGFLGMMVSPDYGGAGLDTVSYVLAMEEISKVDASVSVCMSVNNSLVCYGMESYGPKNKSKNTWCRWHKEKRMANSIRVLFY
jgi:alkylation response protein AidB-like acyl-CoA dehydrogenase